MEKKEAPKKKVSPDKNTIVVSLGGSLIVPEDIDTRLISEFKEIIDEYVALGNKFIIVTGGGRVSRNYQTAVRGLAHLSDEDADWIGIFTTRLNAEFLRIVFGQSAHPRIITEPTHIDDIPEPVAFAGGWKPGNSTDYVAVMIGQQVGAGRVVNLTNVDYVYDKDPHEHSDAEALRDVSWADFRQLIPEEWDPGLNAPFDPVASRQAEHIGLEVAIINGRNLESLRHYLAGEEFDGTLIH